MVTFKLIQLYPGSKPLGYILKPVNNGLTKPDNYYQNGIWFNPSDYPKYWQEVKELTLLEEKAVEKDYEILSFKDLHSSRILTLSLNKQHYQDGNMYILIENLIPNIKNWSIHSVKRLSDGEIFTIGDIVKCEDCKGKITSLEIYDNDIYLNGIDNKMPFGYTLCNTLDCFEIPQKVKQPLFITEDSVDIFEGDSYVALLSNYDLTQEKAGFNHDNIYCHCLKFSTKEKAEEYILMNKPLLSLTDVWDNLKIKDQKEVMKFVKSKLK